MLTTYVPIWHVAQVFKECKCLIHPKSHIVFPLLVIFSVLEGTTVFIVHFNIDIVWGHCLCNISLINLLLMDFCIVHLLIIFFYSVQSKLSPVPKHLKSCNCSVLINLNICAGFGNLWITFPRTLMCYCLSRASYLCGRPSHWLSIYLSCKCMSGLWCELNIFSAR